MQWDIRRWKLPVTKPLQVSFGKFRWMQFILVPCTECPHHTGVFRISGGWSLVSSDTYVPMRRWRALAVVAEHVCPPEGTQSTHTKPNLKTKPNPAWGLLLGDSPQNLTKALEQMASVDAALDYTAFAEESAFYQSNALILAEVSACYLGTHHYLEDATLSSGSNVQL